jgi:Ca2+-binding RTX toxin-like protein
LQEILREWLDEGNVSQLMDSFLTAETAAFIEKLADLYIKGQLDIAELHDPAALAASLSDEFGGLDAFSLVSDMDDLRGLFGEYLVTGYDDDLSAPVSIVGPVGPASPIGPVMIYGTAGNDLLIGTSGNDWVSGGSGNDYIWTGTGNDTVFGGYGSSDTLIKPDMAAGSYLYGDGDTLNLAGTTLDDDLIFVGSTSELEVPDIAFDFINDVEDIDLDSYVAGGNMSGGEIYGDGHTVLGTGWCGDDTIVVQGTMSGGVIYGDAHTAGSGVTLGNDDITVGSMSGGVIYGDAATYDGPANPGSNMIEVSSMMSGGVIYGGEGNDDIKVNNLSGSGVIYGGAGNDIITITGTMSGGEIHTGTGSDEVNIGTVDGTCKIICGDGMDSITIGDVIGGALIIEGFDYAAVDNDIFSFDQTDWVLDRASLAYDYALLEHSTSGATITFIDGKDLVNLFAV